MATFSKKINILKSGTTYKVNVYSTSGEAGSSFTGAIIIDGTQGYYPLCGTSDSRATPGRCLHSNGNTYALATDGVPAYSSKSITAAGSGTFTVPSGVTKLRVTCVGGGAGGVVARTKRSTTSLPNGSYTSAYAASSAGGTTTFGSVSAAGATYAKFVYKTYQDCGGSRDSASCSTAYECTSITASSGTASGYTSILNSDYHAGASAIAVTNYAGTQMFTAGAGGCADGTVDALAAGGSGKKTVSTITVTPGQVINYTVGNYGKGCKYGTYLTSTSNSSDGVNAGRGYVGGILVEWGRGIQ